MQHKESKLVMFYKSQVGRKYITGITGISLILFTLIHLSANLLLFGDGDVYNQYTQKLADLGVLLYVLELGLLAMFLFHAVLGIGIYLQKKKARPQNYAIHKSAGAPSKLSLSSKSMIFTGLILLAFLVLHILTFKYGAHYTTVVDGQEMRDLFTLVKETFQNPIYTFGYVIVMILLGIHLGHGFWSALQSVGIINQRNTKLFYTIGSVVAFILATGFLVIPLWFYFQ